MKIAIFYSGYLPGEKYGGPVTSIYNFTELVGEDNEIFIICTNHDLKDKTPYSKINPGWNKVGKANVLYLSDPEYNKEKFSKILDDIMPDLIYASSIFSVQQTYPLFDLSKKKRIPMLLAPRGELNNNALSLKKTRKRVYLLTLKALRKFSSTYFQATSEEEKRNIVQNLDVDEKKVFLLPNVPSLPVHKTLLEKQQGKLKMCFVGRIVENKNLLVALKSVINASGDIEFDIYGSNEDKEYFSRCQQVINRAPDNIIITYKGVLSPSKMRETYTKYDCLVSPTDFENYGQAIVEAMLHDVPVIISKGTTPWDEIDERKVGFTVSKDDIAAYIRAIDILTNMNSDEYKGIIMKLRSFCDEKFNYEGLKNEYNETYDNIFNDFRRET